MTAIGQATISIVIPALNESASIGGCLASLRDQDYAGPVEVIVVDNGSTDGTAGIAHAAGARVVHEPVRGVCHARQAGTAAATGDIIVSSDADTVFAPDWLSQIDRSLQQPQVVASCGPCRFVDGPWWGDPYTRTLFGIVAAVHRVTGRVLYASATNIAFRRSAWRGYDVNLSQGGDELGLLRSLRREGRITFDPTRVTETSARRLHRGLLYNVFVTCLFFYCAAYLVNGLTGRHLIGDAPAIRPQSDRRPPRPARSLAALGVVAALAVAWWLAPVDVV